MCIGIPKIVQESEGVEGEFAWVAMADGSQQERVNMMLVGPQERGTWVLTSLGTAREVLTEDEASRISSRRPSRSLAPTPAASAAAAMEPRPRSALTMASSEPGRAGIHWSAFRPVSERRAPT